jgi:TolA-binding protein
MAEFEVALRHGGGTRAADSLTMLGLCEIERGNADAAVAHFQQGLELADLTSAARHSLQFELGVAYESQDLLVEAFEQFQAIHAEDASFREVSDRVQRLSGIVKVAARPITRPPARPAAAPRKAAAQSTTAPATARGAGSPDSGPDPARRNRKIGFV